MGEDVSVDTLMIRIEAAVREIVRDELRKTGRAILTEALDKHSKELQDFMITGERVKRKRGDQQPKVIVAQGS